MPWPTPQDYNEAVQNPRISFTDPDLRSGQAELNKIGLPRPIAGGFACVYKIQSGGNLWAARCFLSEIPDQQQRYEAISNHLASVKLPHTVPFTYLANGIKIHGRPYPLVKMQWVQGESLSAFVERSLGYPDTLLSAAKVWSQLLGDLKASGIAHGDLQHGNVIVVGDQLRLLDYDGMYVPALTGKQSNEVGHRNYQLPARTKWDYGPHLDNFSAWVIYVSLVALAIHPELWTQHRGGDECLIFRKEDFEKPKSSMVLRSLVSSPNSQIRSLGELLASMFMLSPQDVPSLDGTLTIAPSISKVQPSISTTNWWDDHDERIPKKFEQCTETITQEIGRDYIDLGWILDATEVEKLAFKSGVNELRVIMAGSISIVALTMYLATIPAAQIAITITFVFGLNILLCYVRFKKDPSRAEFEVFERESKEFARRVQEHQTLLDSISSERGAHQDRLTAVEKETTAQVNQLVALLYAEQNAAKSEFDSQIQVVNQRRRDLSSSETNKLNSIQGSLGNQIAELCRRIAELNHLEVDEKSNALRTLQESHVQNYLRSHVVEESWIPGISETFKHRVSASGLRTAADIDYLKVTNVSGIGQVRGSAFMQWRNGLESQARRAVQSLSRQQREDIESRFRKARSIVESQKQQLQNQFEKQVADIKEYFLDLRQSLNDEEQLLRSVWAQRKQKLQNEHNANTQKLSDKAISTKSQAAQSMSELDTKLQHAQKQVFALRWQTAKRHREEGRFASLGFREYLRKVFVP